MDIYRRLLRRAQEIASGQGLVEYALILVLIAVVSLVVLALLGTEVSSVFSTITSALGVGTS